MKSTAWSQRFLSSTRGRIVAMLRSANRTVNELAESLDLTDNAVRAHLTSLERDGLVQQAGMRRGPRKPHYAYSLTPEAEQLFPKAYGALLSELLFVLEQHLPQGEPETMLREVGHRLAQPHRPKLEVEDLETRLEAATTVLGELGGLATVEAHDGHFFIRGDSCPLATVTSDHHSVCLLAESMVAEIVGLPVQQRCRYENGPQCCFEILTAP